MKLECKKETEKWCENVLYRSSIHLLAPVCVSIPLNWYQHDILLNICWIDTPIEMNGKQNKKEEEKTKGNHK